MEIRRKIMINQRYMAVSPRGFNSESISPRGFNSLSVSPRGFNSFLILFMMTFCFSGFSQTEGKYDVIINKNSKITFTGFVLNKTQPYRDFKLYEVVAPIASNDWKLIGNTGTSQSANFIGTTDNAGLSFRTNNIIRQTISSTGNIGIGTTTPTTLLDIDGSLPTLRINNNMPFADTELRFTQSGSAGDLPVFIKYSNSSDLFQITAAKTNGTTGLLQYKRSTNAVAIGLRSGSELMPKVGIGTTNPTSQLHVQSVVPDGGDNILKLSSGDASWSLGGFDGIGIDFTQNATSTSRIKAGTYSQSGSYDLGFLTGTSALSSGTPQMILTQRGEVGIGAVNPTSTLSVNGSLAETVTVITATTTLNATHNKVVLNNGTTNITIFLPDALSCIGRKYEFSRYAGSTGSVTVVGSGSNSIQALAGTVGATTTLGMHGATGQGLRHSFTAVNIGGIGVWVRL